MQAGLLFEFISLKDKQMIIAAPRTQQWTVPIKHIIQTPSNNFEAPFESVHHDNPFGKLILAFVNVFLKLCHGCRISNAASIG